MAWTAPITWVAQALTAALLNQQIRDNFNETAPGKATTAGRIFVSDGANSIVERTPSEATIVTQETTTSTSYADLATAGPAATVVTGTTALVIVSAQVKNSNAEVSSLMAVDVSSATTITASDSDALQIESVVAGAIIRASSVIFFSTLTAGSNVFTAKYRVGAGTGTFKTRNIIVIPF